VTASDTGDVPDSAGVDVDRTAEGGDEHATRNAAAEMIRPGDIGLDVRSRRSASKRDRTRPELRTEHAQIIRPFADVVVVEVDFVEWAGRAGSAL
jgi:hypothetical protein